MTRRRVRPGVDPEQAAKLDHRPQRQAGWASGPGPTRALAEQLSAKAIRSGKNLEAVMIDMLEAGAKR